MLMVTASPRIPPFLKPGVGATGRPLSFKQLANGTVLIGYRGRAEPDANRTDLDFRKLAASARAVGDLFLVMRAAEIVRAWAGIEARMPDDIPVIARKAPDTRGFQLGPIVGSIMFELVTTGATNLPIAPFDIRRFAATMPR